MNKEIVSFNSGEMAPDTDARDDIEKYASGCRHMNNMIPRIYGPAERRPGTAFVAKNYVIQEIEAANYNWRFYMPEGISLLRNNLKVIYGYDGVHISVHEAGDVNNIGGNLWGLKVIGHPFVAGQQVQIVGAGNLWIVQPETTANELVITTVADLSNWTSDGNDRIHLAEDIYPELMFSGRQATDGTYIYYPCYEEAAYDSCVMRYDVDGTVDTSWKVNPTGGWGGDVNYSMGVFIVDDNTNIIIVTDSRITKATLADGTVLWQVVGHGGYWYGFPAVVGNVIYISSLLGDMRRFRVSDGVAMSDLAGFSGCVRDVVGSIDDGIVVGCKEWGTGYIETPDEEKNCNMVIWDLDKEEVRVRVSLTAPSDEQYWVDIYNGYIYTTFKEYNGNNIAKIDFDGNIIAQALTSFPETNQIVSQYWRFDGKFCVVALMHTGQSAVAGNYIEVFDEDLVSEGIIVNTGRTYGATFSYWTKKHPLEIILVNGVLKDVSWYESVI